MRGRPLIAFFVLLAACSRDPEPGPVATPIAEPAAPKLAAFDECLRGIEAVAAFSPTSQVDLVAEACAGACAGFRDLAAAPPGSHERILAERCGYACPQGARLAAMAAPGEGAAALVEGCGVDYYGLPDGQAAFLSPSWFVLHRIAGWLAAMAPGLDAQRRRKLAAIRFDVDLPLPPLPGLPTSDQVGDARPAALLWLRAGEVARSPAPRARLRGSELRFDGGFEGAPGGIVAGDTAVAADAELLVASLHERLRRTSEPFSLLVRSPGRGVAVHRVRLTPRIGSGQRLQYGPAATVADLVRALDAEPPSGDAAVALEPGVVEGNEVALARPGAGVGATGLGGGGEVTGVGGLGLGGDSGGVVVGVVVGGESGLATLRRGGRARLTELSVSGALGRRLIRRTLRRRWAVQRYCYERALAAAPRVSGSLKVRFAISTEGRVTELVVEAEPTSLDEVARCSRRALEATPFRAAAASTSVSFAIALAPE